MRASSEFFLVTRKIGQGDVEHVRSNLLNVGCYGLMDVPRQVQAAILAADYLQLQPRVHYDTSVLTDDEHKRIQDIVAQGSYLTASEVKYNGFTEETFAESFNKVDIVIETDGPIDDFQQLSWVITNLWKACGKRFAEGNHGRLSREELCEKHFQFGYSYKPFWENLVHKTLTTNWRGST